MKKCYVFPGQGAQSVGMGKDLYDGNPAARAVFDEIDDALGEKLSRLIFEGPLEELNLTANAQVAIFAVSMAMQAAAALDLTGGETYVAGHSLGEYTALGAAKSISVADAARLLRRRGELMQSAVPEGLGSMAAIIGDVDVAAICRDAASKTGGVCEPANDNAPAQFVISGHAGAVDLAMEIAKKQGAKIVKKLAVSAPLHCSLMEPIVNDMRREIEKIGWRAPACGFLSNRTASPMADVAEIKDALAYQLTHGVRWRETVLNLAKLGIEEIIEVGPGNVLTGLNKRISPSVNSYKLEV